MKYTFDELKEKLLKHVNDVYKVFIDSFGERYVDLRLPDGDLNNLSALFRSYEDTDGTYDVSDTVINDFYESNNYFKILVYWPNVTVTNENEKSIDIQDLYAQILITAKGTIPYESFGFLLNRATYDYTQFKCGYMHSHICSIPTSNFTQFQQPCLGSGPIKNTILTLKESNEEANWMLFCQELALYVTVESLTGVPYHRLEEVGVGYSMHYSYTPTYNFYSSYTALRLRENFGNTVISELIKYYLRNGHLVFGFVNGEFCCSMPYFDYIIDVSNAAIDFFNSRIGNSTRKLDVLRDRDIIIEVLVQNRKIFSNGNSTIIDTSRYNGRYICKFKGRDITLRVTDYEGTRNIVNVLNKDLANYILTIILLIVNNNYKNECNRTENEEFTSSCENAILL